ncbi:MAG: hypothetical protein DMG24_08625 [Acidobacteria bacterium]|nr:MAG: hypothetical protein DMG24_08625 [Acidobacteriota bacterium]
MQTDSWHLLHQRAGHVWQRGGSALEAPGYFDIDAAVSRYFNITERQRVELRFEFLSLTNRVNSALRMVSYRMRPSARFLATSALAFYSLR